MSKSISIEFKRECAELVITHGYKLKDAAQAMSMSLSPMQRWVNQYRKERLGVTPKASAITAEQQGIQALEKQVKQLQSDHQLLKKSSAFFAMEMNSDNKLR